MDKQDKLRESVRKMARIMMESDEEFSKQVGASVRTRLGARREQLDRILNTIDYKRLARLPKQQKVDLMVALMQKFGIDAVDFAAIRSRVMKKMKDTNADDIKKPRR